MSTQDFHPEYVKAAPLWAKIRLSQKGQPAAHKAGESILPMTSGMRKKDKVLRDAIYEAYKSRARWYSLTDGYVDTIIGLATEKDYELENSYGDKKVTKNGLDVAMLTQQCLENVALVGRHILVNEAADGVPYIVQYDAESFVDWATDDYGEYIWAKFREEYDADPDPRVRDTQIRYREYFLDDGQWTVYTTDEAGSLTSEIMPLQLPIDENRKPYCPITTLGSRTNKADVDNPPALPIVEASIAAYQLSADYRQGLYGVAQPTPYATGVNDDDLAKIRESGLGVGSFLSTQMTDARFGMLEMSGEGLNQIAIEITKELDIGKEQALRIVNQGNEAESATAIAIRTNGQRATVWTMFNAVSQGIERALMILDRWLSYSGDVHFKIKAEFEQTTAEYNMLNALNATVNAGNAPQAVIFQWLRDANFTTKTDEELANELQTQTPSMIN